MACGGGGGCAAVEDGIWTGMGIEMHVTSKTACIVEVRPVLWSMLGSAATVPVTQVMMTAALWTSWLVVIVVASWKTDIAAEGMVRNGREGRSVVVVVFAQTDSVDKIPHKSLPQGSAKWT